MRIQLLAAKYMLCTASTYEARGAVALGTVELLDTCVRKACSAHRELLALRVDQHNRVQNRLHALRQAPLPLPLRILTGTSREQ